MLFGFQLPVFVGVLDIPVNQVGNRPFGGFPWIDGFVFEDTGFSEGRPVTSILQGVKVLADRWVALPPDLHLVGGYTSYAGSFLYACHAGSSGRVQCVFEIIPSIVRCAVFLLCF